MMSDHASYTSCVSIHASAREATRRLMCLYSSAIVFQSTPPHGRRLRRHALPLAPRCFNPRLRTGGDRIGKAMNSWLIGFNPRLRTGGDPVTLYPAELSAEFQSTPPHGRRLKHLSVDFALFIVSIHASAREATRTDIELVGDLMFQSTPPHGRRLFRPNSSQPGIAVSIHASAREATYSLSESLIVVTRFQSTPPHGRRR